MNAPNKKGSLVTQRYILKTSEINYYEWSSAIASSINILKDIMIPETNNLPFLPFKGSLLVYPTGHKNTLKSKKVRAFLNESHLLVYKEKKDFELYSINLLHSQPKIVPDDKHYFFQVFYFLFFIFFIFLFFIFYLLFFIFIFILLFILFILFIYFVNFNFFIFILLYFNYFILNLFCF